MRSGVLTGSRPNPAVRSAGLGAVAVLLAMLAGCGPAPAGNAVRQRVMLTSGVYHGVCPCSAPRSRLTRPASRCPSRGSDARPRAGRDHGPHTRCARSCQLSAIRSAAVPGAASVRSDADR
jgi:hypothetical protein